MNNRLKPAALCFATACILCVTGGLAYGNSEGQANAITQQERISLARSFLQKMKQGFDSAENFLSGSPKPQSGLIKRETILPDGEQLLFEVFLPNRLKLDSVILARAENNQILISLRDFVTALEFPISVKADQGRAEGFYIRENKRFFLDAATQNVTTPEGVFTPSENVAFDGDDIYVPLPELEKWFDFQIATKVSELKMVIIPPQPLPMQEQIERSKKDVVSKDGKEPVLPRMETPKQLIDVPFVDVATNSRYDRRGDSGRSDTSHTANIRTAGDFAYGTLTTQTLITDEEQVTNVRANYKQESLDGDLLGPLKAKRFELGDVVQTRLPIDTSVSQELGFRVTNTDPLRVFTSPTTSITGNVFPGWDVELYRNNQFLEFQRVGDDGFYSFDNVVLFANENVFELVFYGPQGEIRREEVSIPVDTGRIGEGQGAYDVSLTFDQKQTYRKFEPNDEDEGTPTLRAFYEKPISSGTAVSAGFRSEEENGERNHILYGGVSTLLGETLINANLATDDELDVAAELVARRNLGEHDFISRTRVFADDYDNPLNGEPSAGFFNTQFNANGPLPVGIGLRPQYNASINYNRTNDGLTNTVSTLGMNTRFKRFTLSDQFTHTATNLSTVDDQLVNTLSATGAYGANRLRLLSDYEIRPENKLQRVLAEYRHDFNRDLDINIELERRLDPSITEASAQLNWQAGWARISPSIRYNTENDFFAGLNTNFGLARDPQTNSVVSFDQPITGNGGISVFVFLDRDGNGEFNGSDEPLEEITVRALQNGGRSVTNEHGMAFFERVRELKLTDIFVEEDSLQDPYWISGFDGVSILPREGYVAELQFPILISGEMDGTLYVNSPDKDAGLQPRALRNIPIHLYNADGEIEQTQITDIGGFYLYSRVPPGRYLLVVDHLAAQENNFIRPPPQQIEIGYDGTIIYGNDIFVDPGEGDVPSTVIAGLDDYKDRHPHIDFRGADYNVILNLGEYNSRLLMSTVWYRLHTRYRNILSGGQLLVLPQHSYADEKTGKHTLRVGLSGADWDDAYNRCRALMARDISCKVEFLPVKTQKFAMNKN